jgi:Ca2+-binding RTX toxin-like protein
MLQDESYWGVYGQRFNASGVKVGTEFQVNTTSHDSQQQPTVAGLTDGGFVVSWEGQYQDGNQQGIFQNGTASTEIIMQRYDVNGIALGNSFAGGSGNDTITIGGTSNIEIDGAAGNDILTSGAGNDTLRGDAGNDTLDGGMGTNVIIGGDGVDILKLAGLAKDYKITGTNGSYLVEGITTNVSIGLTDNLQGIEKLQFSDGSLQNLNGDVNQGGGTVGVTLSDTNTDGVTKTPGTNIIPGVTILEGTSGDDILTAGNTKGKSDEADGGDGNDLYIALGKLLVIYDTGGIDTLQISTTSIDLSKPLIGTIKGLEYLENVTLKGKAALNITGNDVTNVLIGNDGNNSISGGAGDDIIYGGLGNDKLSGGDGMDTFVFNSPLTSKNKDNIIDFNGDKILLDSTIFKGLDSSGHVDANGNPVINFIAGAGVTSASSSTASFIVYNSKTGNLYYDAALDPDTHINPGAILITHVGVPTLDTNGNTVNGPALLTADNFGLLV